MRDWSSGRTVWSRFGLQPRVIDGRKTIAAYVTGEMFGPGTYEVVVAGPDGQMAASYELAVTPPAAR